MASTVQSVTARRAQPTARAAQGAVVLIGFSAVIGQIVLMRELIVVFSGNEMSLGIMLATWLFWTAAGSYISSIIKLAERNPRRVVATLECLLGLSLLPTISLLRNSRSVFQAVPGELIGPLPMILTSFVSLSIFCAFSGSLFVAAMRLYEQASGVTARAAASSAYLLEAAGAGSGGILASIFLLRCCNSFQIAAIVLLLNAPMAAILYSPMRRMQIVAVALGIGLGAVLLAAWVVPFLEQNSQARLWRGFHLLASRESIYGKLAIIETGEIRSIYDNGIILASAPDESAAEEAVHYALLEHPAPRHLLLIGGGVNGSIAQALKHPTVERIDYVELDPAVISIARQYFPGQSQVFSDARVHLHYADGRHYLRTTGDTFDVIIVDLPDPQTAQLNRFYTREFFASAREHLAPAGLLALQLRASEDYISQDLAAFLRCIQHTLKQVFPHVAVIPGENMHFVAAMQAGELTENPQTLISRLRARNVETHYVREYFLPFRMMPDRMAQVHDLLRSGHDTPVNRDFAPIAYYFNVELWNAQFSTAFARWLRNAAQRSFSSIVAASCFPLLLLALLLVSAPLQAQRARAIAAFCVTVTGFTLMAQQVLLLLLFQSVYGYVYHQLAILIAMFMAGIALGSWLGIRQSRAAGCPMRRVASAQFLLAASAPLLMGVIALLAQSSQGSTTLLSSQVVFPALAVISGMIGGYQFPVATEIYLVGAKAHRGLGTLYALDLFGGCVGALLLSGYLIPVYGFWKTAWFTAAVNLAPVVLAAKVSREPLAVQP
jgi:spermidine synthase